MPYRRVNNANVQVYEDTQAYFEANRVPVMPEKVLNIGRILRTRPEPPANNVMQLSIENCDSFELAMRYQARGFNPLVLNMASNYKPGGGVATGARAQEEALFRCSNYFQCLDARNYPLPDNRIILSPLVHICKDAQYNLLPKLVPVACLAVAAIRKPSAYVDRRGWECYRDASDLDLMRAKINAIFETGIAYGYDTLVLGALGCGAFANPVHTVAQLFKEAIHKYAAHFKNIGFAILTLPGDARSERNLDIFTEFLMPIPFEEAQDSDATDNEDPDTADPTGDADTTADSE